MKTTRFSLPFLFLLLMAVGMVKGQTVQPTPPDCVVFISMTADGSGTLASSTFDNRTWQCESWTVGYQAIGTGALTTLDVQSAPVAAGGVAGTWATYPGTVVTGINPNTSSTGAVTELSNGAVVTPFMRVLLTEGTFVGPVTGVLYGWRTRGSSNGGGGGGGCANPCTVIQPTAANLNAQVVGAGAAGAAATGNPVLVAGYDGTNARTVKTDTAGRPAPALASLAGADGTSNTVATPTTEAGAQLYNRVLPSLFNGATNDRQFTCNLTQAFDVTADTDVVIVSNGGGATVTRLCGFSFSSDVAATVTLQEGTGMACGTGTAALSGGYNTVLAMALDFGNWGGVRATAAADMCLHFSTAVTAGGMAYYAQY